MAANDLVQTRKDLPKITLVLENVKQSEKFLSVFGGHLICRYP
jgi:hypothetical protein